MNNILIQLEMNFNWIQQLDNIKLKKNEVKIGGKMYSKSSYEYGVGKINFKKTQNF
jgi:hypothetical protein